MRVSRPAHNLLTAVDRGTCRRTQPRAIVGKLDGDAEKRARAAARQSKAVRRGQGRPCRSDTSGDRFFELNFGGEAVAITPDRQHRQFAAALPVSHRAVLRRKASVNLNAVPMRGVPDIVELQIVLLGPEERHRVEALARPEHVSGSRLALPFGDDPVLDAEHLASEPVGPPGDIAGGPDPGDARLEIRVNGDAAVNSNPGPFGERGLRPHPDPDDDEVGIALFALFNVTRFGSKEPRWYRGG